MRMLILRESYILLIFLIEKRKDLPSFAPNTEESKSRRVPKILINLKKVNPKDILVETIEPSLGLTEANLKNIIKTLELESIEEQAKEQLKNLYKMFVSLDLLQLEINPWATNEKNVLYCIDGKLNVDDNAKFRQPELVEMQHNSLGSEEVDIHEQTVKWQFKITVRL